MVRQLNEDFIRVSIPDDDAALYKGLHFPVFIRRKGNFVYKANIKYEHSDYFKKWFFIEGVQVEKMQFETSDLAIAYIHKIVLLESV